MTARPSRRPALRRSLALAAVAALGLVAATGCRAVREEDEEVGTPVTDPLPATTVTGTATVPPTTAAPITLDAVAVRLEQIAQVDQPTALTYREGDFALYVTERPGRVRRIAIALRQNGAQTFTLDRSPVLDIRDAVRDAGQEQGLLGIAFSTDGNRLYVTYTAEDGTQNLVEYRMNGNAADTRSRRLLLTVPDFAENHNGGALAFGPDGFLYWSMGDGGGGGDPQGTGQDPTDLLGALLRIDPDVAADAGVPYAIPDGNPFRSGEGGAPEVWAYGLRNPWKFSFDRATGDLWIGDVGQGEVEEIDFVPAGPEGNGAGRAANFGWSEREGDVAFEDGREVEGAVAPLLTYRHSETGGCSVTGGYVYRGTRIPALQGAYVWADFCLGQIQALVQRDGAIVAQRDLGVNVPQVSAFGQDRDGEVYVLSLQGTIFRLFPA